MKKRLLAVCMAAAMAAASVAGCAVQSAAPAAAPAESAAEQTAEAPAEAGGEEIVIKLGASSAVTVERRSSWKTTENPDFSSCSQKLRTF